MGEKELMSFQLGTQTTFVDAVAGSVKLMDVTEASLTPTVKTERRQYLRASRAPAYVAVVTSQDGKGKLTCDVSYEDFNYWLEGLFGTVTPGSVAPYTRDYSAPLASALTPRIYTAIYGDSDGVYKLTGALTSKVVIKCDSVGVMTAAPELIGKDVTTGSLASLADRTINPVVGADVSIYLDAWAGTIGTTQIENLAYSFELTIDAKRALKQYLTGSLTPTSYKQPAFDVSLKLHLEFAAASKAYVDAILASTAGAPFERQVRIKATRDTSTSLKLMQFDFAGAHNGSDGPEVYAFEDGVAAVDIDMDALYNPTLGNYFKASSKCSVAALA